MFSSRLREGWGIGPAIAVVAVFTVGALGANAIAGDPLTQRFDAVLLRPLEGGFLLGTDHLGRDVLARLLHGARSSLIVSLGAATVAVGIGTTFGIVAGLDRRGHVDRVLQLLSDSLLAFPTILLAIAVAAVLTPGRRQVLWTLGIVFSPVLFRISRVAARSIAYREFYQVSRLLQTPRVVRVILHLLPNVVPQVVVQGASLAAVAIGTEAALSFLGLGAQPPEPSWGLMLADARRYLATAPHLSVIPGVAAGLLAFAFQYLSDLLAGTVAGLEQ